MKLYAADRPQKMVEKMAKLRVMSKYMLLTFTLAKDAGALGQLCILGPLV